MNRNMAITWVLSVAAAAGSVGCGISGGRPAAYPQAEAPPAASGNLGRASPEKLAGPKALPIPPDLKPMIERAQALGRQIYVLDQASAIGTNALLAHLHLPPAAELPGLGGHITLVEPDGGRSSAVRVLFFTRDATPKVAYRTRVALAPGSPAPAVEAVQPPEEPSPPSSLIIRARQAALASVQAELTQPVRPLVVPAATVGEQGFLVYLIAGTRSLDTIVFGKHYRILVAADGQTIKEVLPLTKTVLEMSAARASPRSGGSRPRLTVTHLVTDYPLETHVLISLLHRMRFFVETDRGVWGVDGDRIFFVGTLPDQPRAL